MSDFIEVTKIGDLKDGAIRKSRVDGKDLLIVKVGGEYFCADARCPHMSGDLTKGIVEGTILTCPVHGSQFDLKDGRVIRWTDMKGLSASVIKLFKAPKPLKTYPVKVDGEKLLVRLE